MNFLEQLTSLPTSTLNDTIVTTSNLPPLYAIAIFFGISYQVNNILN